MNNPFTQDHHGLTKEATPLGSPAAAQQFVAPQPKLPPSTQPMHPGYARPSSPTATDPDLLIPGSTANIQQTLTDQYTQPLSKMWTRDIVNNANASMNSMGLWEKIRLMFTTGIGKLLDKFNVKHNFYDRANSIKRDAFAKTWEQRTGIAIPEDQRDEILGPVSSFQDDQHIPGLLQGEKSPLRDAHGHVFDNTSQALAARTADVGNQNHGILGTWKKLVPGDMGKKLDQENYYKQTQDNPDKAQEWADNAFTAGHDTNVLNYTPVDKPTLFGDLSKPQERVESNIPFMDANNSAPEPYRYGE